MYDDFMEVQYGLQCLSDAYLKSETGKKFQSVLNHLFAGLRPEIEQLFDRCQIHLRTDTYFMCVSEHKLAKVLQMISTMGR